MQVKYVYPASSYPFELISYQILIALFKSQIYQSFLSYSKPIIKIYLPEIWNQFSNSLQCFIKFFDQQIFQRKLKDKCLSSMHYRYQDHKKNLHRQQLQEAKAQSDYAASLKMQQLIENMCVILTKSIFDIANYQVISILLYAQQLIYQDYLCLSLIHRWQLLITLPQQANYYHLLAQLLIENHFFQEALQAIDTRMSHSDCQTLQEQSKLILFQYFVYSHTARNQPHFYSKKINILKMSLKLNPYNQTASELLIDQAVENNLGYVRYYIEQYMAATGNQTYFLPVLAYVNLYFNEIQKMKQNLAQMKSLIDNGSATNSFFRYCQFKNKINLKLSIFQINIQKSWPVHQQRSHTFRCLKQAGIIYYKHQQYESAKRHFYCCRALLPEQQDYIDILIALCLLSQERYQEAQIWIQRFDSADFDGSTESIGVLLMLGGVYSRLSLIERLGVIFHALNKKQQLQTVQNSIQLNLLKLLNANKITLDQQIVYNQTFKFITWVPPRKAGLFSIYRFYHQIDALIQYSFNNNKFNQGRRLLHSVDQIIAMTAVVSKEWSCELKEKLMERIHRKIELMIW